MGQGCQILWPHNSPSKACCLAPRVGRRILMSSGHCHSWSSLVPCRASSPAQGTLLAFWYTRCAVSNTFMERRWSLRYMRRAFIGALWSDVDLAVEGFLGNWVGLISLVIPSLNFVRIKFPLDFAFYIRHPGRTVLSHLQTPEFCRNSSSPPFRNQECCLNPGRRSWGKGSKGQRFFYLSSKKENLPPSARNHSKSRLRQAFGATEFGSHPDGRTFCS